MTVLEEALVSVPPGECRFVAEGEELKCRNSSGCQLTGTRAAEMRLAVGTSMCAFYVPVQICAHLCVRMHTHVKV